MGHIALHIYFLPPNYTLSKRSGYARAYCTDPHSSFWVGEVQYVGYGWEINHRTATTHLTHRTTDVPSSPLPGPLLLTFL